MHPRSAPAQPQRKASTMSEASTMWGANQPRATYVTCLPRGTRYAGVSNSTPLLPRMSTVPPLERPGVAPHRLAARSVEVPVRLLALGALGVELAPAALGICLGHQLLADATGGTVGLAKSPEVGVLTVSNTE